MADNIYILVAGAMIGIFFIVFLMIFLQIKTQNRILQQKKTIAESRIQHQNELARILIISQEDERKRIGMNLHDEVGTALSSLRMLLEKMNDGNEKEPLHNLTLSGKRSIDNIINNVRRISHNLSPFTKNAYELADALDDLCEQINSANGLLAAIDYNSIQKFDFLEEDSQLALYRILSELINNTIKHASATSLRISFLNTGSLLMVNYSDDGIGMVNTGGSKNGIGMANIESRCNLMKAVFSIRDNKTKGFGIEIKIPVK